MLAYFCSSNTCEVEAGGQKFSITLGYIVLDEKDPTPQGKKNKEKETTVTTINLNEVKLDADWRKLEKAAYKVVSI